MREKLSLFVADISRFGPLAIVTLTTLLCLPSLEEFIEHRLALTSMLGRYCVALFLATLGVRVVSRFLIRYALRNVSNAEKQAFEAHLRSQSDQAPT